MNNVVQIVLFVFAAAKKQIKIIARTIRKDKNDTVYNLEKFDDEIAQLDQDLAMTNRQKKDALNTFDTVTKTIISDEIMGNHKAEVDQMVLDFPVLADYALMPLGNRIMFITHGHIFNEQHLPPLKDGDILLHGHTHVPKCVDYGTYTYMNPGSISIPKENSHHGYMTLENDVFRWKDINGNLISEYSLR